MKMQMSVHAIRANHYTDLALLFLEISYVPNYKLSITLRFFICPKNARSMGWTNFATKIVQSERICKKNKDFLLNMKKKCH